MKKSLKIKTFTKNMAHIMKFIKMLEKYVKQIFKIKIT